jgi:Trypsin-like peptidase domain
MKQIFMLTVFALIAQFTEAAEIPEEVRTRSKAATVKVTSEEDQQFGSGFVISQNNSHTYLLTAYHVVPTANKVKVRVQGGKIFSAEVLARASENDLAVLRIAGTKDLPSPLRLAASGAKPKNLVSLGWEKSDAPTCLEESLKGKVPLKKPGETNPVLCWETERKPAAGRSGGPLMDETGLVLGLASGHDGKTGYYIHIDEIQAFLRHNGLDWLAEEERR